MPIRWIFNYKCGCDSEPGRKRDLTEYCPTHGDEVIAQYTTKLMSRREARRSAYRVVAALIESYLGVGQPHEECNDHDNAHNWQPGDADQLEVFFKQIMEEMERRGADPIK